MYTCINARARQTAEYCYDIIISRCVYLSVRALRASYSFRVYILYARINEQTRVKPQNRLIICNALQLA